MFLTDNFVNIVLLNFVFVFYNYIIQTNFSWLWILFKNINNQS